MGLVFRPLARADFTMVARWLATPEVRRWWNNKFTPEAIENDFGGSVDGTEPTDIYIASLLPAITLPAMSAGPAEKETPVGLIQYYLIHDYDEYIEEFGEANVTVPKTAGSIDYLIGEPDHLGRGLGTAMIAGFDYRLWQTEPDLTSLVVPVSTANEASWRALAAAGFARQADVELEPDNPIDDWAHVLMTISRPAETVPPHQLD